MAKKLLLDQTRESQTIYTVGSNEETTSDIDSWKLMTAGKCDRGDGVEHAWVGSRIQCEESAGTCAGGASVLEGSCAQAMPIECPDNSTAGCEADGSGGFQDACGALTAQAACEAVDSDSDPSTADCTFTAGGISKANCVANSGTFTTGATFEAGESIDAAISSPNAPPVVVAIDNVWPHAWTCQANCYNDGAWCDTNCGMFDPDCGRVRSTADPDLAGEAPDGYWYINPALKRCTDDMTSVMADKATGDMACYVDGADLFDAATHDSAGPCGGGGGGGGFGWVTWDNLDLDRDGTFEFRSGDLVPSGTTITMDWAGGPGGTHCFDPYSDDIDSDGNVDVAIDPATLVPADRLPPIHTPPYHPSQKVRFGPVSACTPTADGVTAAGSVDAADGVCNPTLQTNLVDCGKEPVGGSGEALCEVTAMGTCAGGTVACGPTVNAADVEPCTIEKMCVDGGGTFTAGVSDLYYGAEYAYFSVNTDLKAMTKWGKQHPAGMETAPFYKACSDSDAEASLCQELDISYRQPNINELPAVRWAEGTFNLYMDALEMVKGYYLEDDTPAGTVVSTAKMSDRNYFSKHANPMINQLAPDTRRRLKTQAGQDRGGGGAAMPSPASTQRRWPGGPAAAVAARRQQLGGEAAATRRRQLEEVSATAQIQTFSLSPDAASATVSRFFEIKIIRDEQPYLPADWHLPSAAEPTTAPEVLDVDLSVFTVPERKTFAGADGKRTRWRPACRPAPTSTRSGPSTSTLARTPTAGRAGPARTRRPRATLPTSRSSSRLSSSSWRPRPSRTSTTASPSSGCTTRAGSRSGWRSSRRSM
eukprot:SAG22_NODE_124_length_18884_cov_34.149367_9_plen_818_part_00